ncbi:YpmS family protein [Dellaglioa carnosa]|uniref:YpmS family protein n=1 Tax=Dellaglioa carnosa TaxID=2995136 RepID=A0ABT4JKP4_9LACO|nr:YpmS family protein [Dellaglioa carnosa]MCZ2490932.1 YpmS family protein [Dellaglioa carnosa]MCZ2494010.1 YpmS family protein [Dellaglioa carnosa]MDK1730874.1 YpmS family protein [Dellaglioa carnosa]
MAKRSEQIKLKTKKNINAWKIAFIVLLSLLIGTALYLSIGAMSQSKDQKALITQTNSKSTKRTNLSVEMNKDQLNGTINYYLKSIQKGQSIKYRFLVDKSAILMGTTKVLGQDVSFTLYSDPIVTSSGDIVLKAKSVAVGALPVPKKFIMNYVKKAYDLPSWITIDSKNQTIVLNLKKLDIENGIQASATKIDLKTNVFKFNVSIPLN